MTTGPRAEDAEGCDGGGPAALERWAPDVAVRLDELERMRVAGASDRLGESAVAELADQFAVDVTRIDDAMRARFAEATGADAFTVVQLVWVDDVVPRVRAALDALFGASEEAQGEPVVVDDTWSRLDGFMRAVARLDELDATTTELVRLRGARQHACRLCASRRSVAAIDAGASEETFAAVDRYETSDLPDAARAALAMTDAMIWTPRAVPPEVVARVRAHLTPAQAVEVVLDVARNAANKMAVALGADAPEVSEGVQLFTTDADGNLTTVPA